MDKAIPRFANCTVDERGVVKLNGKVLSTFLNGRGYLKVFLPAPDGKRKSLRVHRLVAEAFVPNPDGLPVVDHDDGNKLNNNASNLVWVTHQENSIKSLAQKVRERKPIARMGKGDKVLEVFLSISQAAKYKQCDYRGLYEAVKNGTKYKGDRWVHCEIDIKLEE